jgi:hypothetical protein
VPGSDAEVPKPGVEAAPPIFEQSDFEDYLRFPFSEEAARHAAASRGRGGRPVPPAAPLVIDVEKLPDAPPASPPETGIVLTPTIMTILVVSVILLLSAAFAAGVAVDRLFLIKPVP